MGKKPRATLCEIRDYLFRPPHPIGNTQVERLDIPGHNKLVIKMIPTHETVNRKNSREPAEKLFGILHSNLSSGVYEVLEEKMFEKVCQNYNVSELIEMREMTAVFDDIFAPQSNSLYKLLDRQIQSRIK